MQPATHLGRLMTAYSSPALVRSVSFRQFQLSVRFFLQCRVRFGGSWLCHWETAPGQDNIKDTCMHACMHADCMVLHGTPPDVNRHNELARAIRKQCRSPLLTSMPRYITDPETRHAWNNQVASDGLERPASLRAYLCTGRGTSLALGEMALTWRAPVGAGLKH